MALGAETAGRLPGDRKVKARQKNTQDGVDLDEALLPSWTASQKDQPMKTALELRSPDDVMQLKRLGAAHPTRLSFLRAMMRQAIREDWAFSVPLWAMSKEGYGHALLTIDTGRHRYSLVCFSTPSPMKTARTA